MEPDATLVARKELKQPAKVITLTLMTPCALARQGAGVLALANTVIVLYDPQTFTPVMEEIELDDSRLRSTWGERLFRILLRAGNPQTHAVWTTRITQ